MAGVDFTYTVGFQANTKALTDSIKVFDKSLKQNPVDLSVALPNLDTTKLQPFFDSIKASAKDIEGLTVKTQTMLTSTGQKVTQITGATVKWRDANNNLQTSFAFIENNISGLSKQVTLYDSMGKKAAEWGNRANTMGEQEKNAIQGSAEKLINLITKYKELGAAGHYAEAEQLKPAIEKTNRELDKQIASSRRSAEGVRNWSTRITDAVKNTVSYALSLGLVREAQQQLNQAMKFAIELNTEMTKIQLLQVEGAQSSEEIYALSQSYNALAQSMGVATLEVAKGSVEWLRQGKTIEETTELLKASTMLSKLGAIEAAEATEFLTSAINGYGMSAKDAVSIVDKLIAVDNVAATSAKELATALRYSSAVAADAGVSFEQLVSYIGVISQTTRQNAEMIGQALKTIFTRMQDIRAGKLDEDGLGINNAAIALQRVDIQLMENETTFRDFGSVLEELSGKWDTLNEVEQANIAKAIAGVRQQNMFRVLMSNMNTALKLQEEQYNATGLAADRYGIYLESIAAKQAEFKSALESLYMEEGFQKLIADVIDLGTEFLKLIKSIGGAKTVVIGLALAFTATKIPELIIQFKKLGTAIHSMGSASKLAAQTAKTAEGAFGGLGAAAAGGWIGIAVAGVALLTLFISKLITTAKEAREKLQELNQEAEDARNKLEQTGGNRKKLQELSLEYDSLQKKTSLTADEAERLKSTQEEINSLLPTKLTGSYEQQNFLIKEQIKLLEEKEKLEAEIAREAEQAAALQAIETAKKSARELEGYKKKLDRAMESEKRERATLDRLEKAGQTNSRAYFETSSRWQKALRDIAKFQEKVKAAELDQINAQQSSLSAYQNITDEKEKQYFFDRLDAETQKYILGYLKEQGEIVLQAFPGAKEMMNQRASDFSMAGKDAYDAWQQGFLEALSGEDSGLETFKQYVTKYGYDLGVAMYLQFQKGKEDARSLSEEGKKAPVVAPTDEEFTSLTSGLIKELEALDNIKKKVASHEVLTPEEITLLESYGVEIKGTADNLNIAEEAWAKVNWAIKDNFIKTNNLTDEQIKLVESLDLVNTAFMQQSSAAGLSAEMQNLVAIKGKEAGIAINEETGELEFLTPEAKATAEAVALVAIAQAELKLQTAEAAGATLDERNALSALVERARATYNEIKNASVAIDEHSSATGGAASSTNAFTDAINEQIEALERQKEAFNKMIDEQIEALKKEEEEFEKGIEKRIKRKQEQIDQYKEYIDLQKDSLKAQKEEAEFQDELDDKNKELADIQNEMLALELDNSDEAKARRLELEQEKADKIEEIEELQADRTYDLQIEALDKAEEEYVKKKERKIKLLEEELAAFKENIEAQIEALEDQKKAFNDSIETQIDGWKQLAEWAERNKGLVNQVSTSFKGATTSVWQYINALKNIPDVSLPGFHGGGIVAHSGGLAFHEGGQVQNNGTRLEKHHSSASPFAGNLNSNEVFAKLLKGEYVATEGQMDNFLRHIMPKLMAGKEKIYNKTERSYAVNDSVSVGDIIINVNGTLDRTVVPDIKKAVFSVMNEALQQRGKKPDAFAYSV
jgi:TP901 family phage tail tape measure protein